MAHWVMIEMAKLSKEKRDRIVRLTALDLCIDCECKKQAARGNCQACLNVLYSKKKYGDPMEAAEYENKKTRQGRLLPVYDKRFSEKKKRIKAS